MTRKQLIILCLCHAILAADEAATEGPWIKWFIDDPDDDYPVRNILSKVSRKEQTICEEVSSYPNGNLIALFRTAAPALATAVLEMLEVEDEI